MLVVSLYFESYQRIKTSLPKFVKCNEGCPRNLALHQIYVRLLNISIFTLHNLSRDTVKYYYCCQPQLIKSINISNEWYFSWTPYCPQSFFLLKYNIRIAGNVMGSRGKFTINEKYYLALKIGVIKCELCINFYATIVYRKVCIYYTS